MELTKEESKTLVDYIIAMETIISDEGLGIPCNSSTIQAKTKLMANEVD